MLGNWDFQAYSNHCLHTVNYCMLTDKLSHSHSNDHKCPCMTTAPLTNCSKYTITKLCKSYLHLVTFPVIVSISPQKTHKTKPNLTQ